MSFAKLLRLLAPPNKTWLCYQLISLRVYLSLENPRTLWVLHSVLLSSQAFVHLAVCQHGARNQWLLSNSSSLLWTCFLPLLPVAPCSISNSSVDAGLGDEKALAPCWKSLLCFDKIGFYLRHACFPSSASFIEVPKALQTSGTTFLMYCQVSCPPWKQSCSVISGCSNWQNLEKGVSRPDQI